MRGLLRLLWGNPAYTDMVLKIQGRGRTERAQSEERTWVLGHSEGVWVELAIWKGQSLGSGPPVPCWTFAEPRGKRSALECAGLSCLLLK